MISSNVFFSFLSPSFPALQTKRSRGRLRRLKALTNSRTLLVESKSSSW